MGYGDRDPYIDEDGEEVSPGPMDPHNDDDMGDWRRERSPTPVHESTMDKGGGKTRKRLVKKNVWESTPESGGNPKPYGGGDGLDDWEEDGPSSSKKRKVPSMSSKEGKRGCGKKEKMKSKLSGKWPKLGAKGYEALRDRGHDSELNEMQNTIAGGDSKAEEGKEGEEISQLFKGGNKKKKNEKSPAELALVVEHLMAELEVAAEEDAKLNRQSKPAINKLKKLPLLIEVLSKKNLQPEFLDHGVLTLLKNWLELLPDGSLPSRNIRTAILNILTDFPIDLEQYDRREQLKKSGLGKVIMFLSKSDEETTADRRLAKNLVDKWSRPIFNRNSRYEDMRTYDDERIPYRQPSAKKPVTKTARLESRDDDLDEFSQGPKSGQGASRQHASRPEPLPLDFAVRPQSKIDPEEVRARAKQVTQDQHRIKMNKKLQKLKAPKKKQLQAMKLSVEGRGHDQIFVM